MGHRVFISYHHKFDQYKKNKLARLIEESGNFDYSVEVGDIENESGISDERIYQIIRDDYLRETTVTILILGRCTHHRKHIDREIGSSLMSSKYNSRNGLVVLVADDYLGKTFLQADCGERISKNILNGYAIVSRFSDVENNPYKLNNLIQQAYSKRNNAIPDNSAIYRRRNTSCYYCG